MAHVTNDAPSADRFALALGRAVVEIWSALPRNIQQMVFEQAVFAGHRTERDESLREELAGFLHARHPRTSGEAERDRG